jgi:hypothetical protein
MAGEDGAVVEERNALGVLIDHGRGEIAPGYFAKNAARRGHGVLWSYLYAELYTL